MKALSLHQPYAGLIYEGRKTIETRSWRTDYRGDLLICSTIEQSPMVLDLVRRLATSLDDHFTLFGHALCVVRLAECRPMRMADERAACCAWDYGRFAWVLEDVRPIKPARIRGHHRIWNADFVPEFLASPPSAPPCLRASTPSENP